MIRFGMVVHLQVLLLIGAMTVTGGEGNDQLTSIEWVSVTNLQTH